MQKAFFPTNDISHANFYSSVLINTITMSTEILTDHAIHNDVDHVS